MSASPAQSHDMAPIGGRFWIDRHEVTVGQFRAFAGATGLVTRAERGRGHVPVRTTKAGVNGLWDMGGNVWEWVDHEAGGEKRTRGGSWWYGPAQMRADALYEKPADFPAVYIGFRCARDA